MKLRDIILGWPPIWTQGRSGKKTLKGALGTLRRVDRDGRFPNKCFLVMEYDNELYATSISLDDANFCSRFIDVLQSHIGRSIQEIGDLDFGH